MTDDRALEVKLIGMRVLANGEVNLPFVVQKDDAWKTQTFIGMIGRPFQMILIPINYEATEDFVPLTSADFTKAALTPGVIGTQDSAADNSGGIPPTERTDTRTAPEAELKQSPGPNRLAQHIGRVCNDVKFQGWLCDYLGKPWDAMKTAEQWVPEWVRTKCKVASRADILPGTKAEQAWKLIESAYLAETRI